MKTLNWDKVTNMDCKRCKSEGKVYSERLKRKTGTNNFYCDGCGYTTTLNQIQLNSNNKRAI